MYSFNFFLAEWLHSRRFTPSLTPSFNPSPEGVMPSSTMASCWGLRLKVIENQSASASILRNRDQVYPLLFCQDAGHRFPRGILCCPGATCLYLFAAFCIASRWCGMHHFLGLIVWAKSASELYYITSTVDWGSVTVSRGISLPTGFSWSASASRLRHSSYGYGGWKAMTDKCLS